MPKGTKVGTHLVLAASFFGVLLATSLAALGCGGPFEAARHDASSLLATSTKSKDPCKRLWVFYHEDWGQSGELQLELWDGWLTVTRQVLPPMTLLESIPPQGYTASVNIPLDPEQCRSIVQALLDSKIWEVPKGRAGPCGPGEPVVELSASIGQASVVSLTGCRWVFARHEGYAKFLGALEKLRRSAAITFGVSD